jgi:hypothetical protein
MNFLFLENRTSRLHLPLPPQQIHHLGQGPGFFDLFPDAVFFFQGVHDPMKF